MKMHSELSGQYILSHTTEESDVLKALYRETWLKVHAPQMMASHVQGSLLRMISWMISPQNILEIGTFTGYSAICLAEGLKPGGKLHTIELNPELEEIANRYFELSGMQERIVRYQGDAIEIIPLLNITFDLVYIDAGKECYIELYELSLQKLNTGGFILADNALWYQKVADPSVINDKDTDAIRRFNDYVHNDTRTENMILPLEDGIMIIRKK